MDDVEARNKLQDCIVNLEVFFRNNVEGYIYEKQAEFDETLDKFTYRGIYSGSVAYQQWNVVTHLGESYLCLADTINNTPNPNAATAYWAKIAEKGATGAQGPQGVPGVGLNYQGYYNELQTYYKDDLVTYVGSTYIYISDTPSSGQTPQDNGNPWLIYIAKGSNTILATYTNRTTITATISTVGIGISQFNPVTDALDVYLNGAYLKKPEDYTVSADGISITKASGSWTASSSSPAVFDFTVLKNAVNEIMGSDGALIIDGTISILKLVPGLQSQINNAVPNTRMVNGKVLSTDIILSAGDVGAATTAAVTAAQTKADNATTAAANAQSTAANAQSTADAANTLATSKATYIRYTATIPTLTASTNYTSVTFSGILATDNPIIDTTGTTDTQRDNWSKITRIVTAANAIRVYRSAATTGTIPIQILVFRNT